MTLTDLQSSLSHPFKDPAHLERALTTNSYVNEWNHTHPGDEPIESQGAFATLGDPDEFDDDAQSEDCGAECEEDCGDDIDCDGPEGCQ